MTVHADYQLPDNLGALWDTIYICYGHGQTNVEIIRYVFHNFTEHLSLAVHTHYKHFRNIIIV